MSARNKRSFNPGSVTSGVTGTIHDPDPIIGFDQWNFGPLPELGRVAVKVGLLRLHARFLDSSAFRWPQYLRDAFDVIAGQFHEAHCLTEAVLKKTIPPLVSNAAIGGRWNSWGGSLRQNQTYTTLFGYWWVKEGVPEQILQFTQGRMIWWSTLILEGKRRRGPEPHASNPEIAAIVRATGGLGTDARLLSVCQRVDGLEDPPEPPVGDSWVEGLTLDKAKIRRSLRHRSRH